MTLSKLNTPNVSNTSVGKDFLYVCLNPGCGHTEREFAVPSRHSKLCTQCGSQSVKNYLTDTLDWWKKGLPVVKSEPAVVDLSDQDVD